MKEAASDRRWRANKPLSPIDGMPIDIKDIIETERCPQVHSCITRFRCALFERQTSDTLPESLTPICDRAVWAGMNSRVDRDVLQQAEPASVFERPQ